VNSIIKRVDQMEGSQINRCRGRSKKTIRDTIKKDLEIRGIKLDCCCWLGLLWVSSWFVRVSNLKKFMTNHL
jgi:hypothetical protein